MYDNWNILLSEFRRLGGIVENVCQKEGEFGRGIFAVDQNLKSRIYTPSELIIKKDDIFLENKKIRIKKDKKYNQEVKDFFHFYQDNFSWGGGGKETTKSFEKGLSMFSESLKKLIKNYILVDIEKRHKGNWDEVVKQQFLNARQVKFKKEAVIVPIWELVNHDVISLPFIIKVGGVSIPNYSPIRGEITQSYNNTSALNRFFSYGFFSEETIVFSVPFSVHIKDAGIQINCKGISLQEDSMIIKRSANTITINGLPIADVNNPRLPYDYFTEILRKIGNSNIPEDLLFKIFQLNISIRQKIIDESQLVDDKVSNLLAEVMNYEMNLILNDN